MQKSTVILFVAITALGIFAIWQQYQINQLRNEQAVPAVPSVPAANAGVVTQESALSQVNAIKNNLFAMKTISGTVVSSTASEIIIKTNLVNLSALSTVDFKASQALLTLNKNLTIVITKNTMISGGKIVAGGSITVQTKEPVYGGGTLTAVSVNTFAVPLQSSPATGM